MDAEDFLVHQDREGEEVKQVSEVLPDIWATIMLQALIVKPVDLNTDEDRTSGGETRTWVICRDSWLPRRMWMRDG